MTKATTARADCVAEGVGFEPTRAFALPVFKTGAINHSTTPPDVSGIMHSSTAAVLINGAARLAPVSS